MQATIKLAPPPEVAEPEIVVWLKGVFPGPDWASGDSKRLTKPIIELLGTALYKMGLPLNTFEPYSNRLDPVQAVVYLLTRDVRDPDGLRLASEEALELPPIYWTAHMLRYLLERTPPPLPLEPMPESEPLPTGSSPEVDAEEEEKGPAPE